MANRPTLKAQKRNLSGRKVKQLRRLNQLPANIFGKKIQSISIQVNALDFNKIYQEVGETGLVDVVVDADKPRPVLITNIQYHPTTSEVLHADLHQVDLAEKVTANIPVELVGESPAVKDKGGVLVAAVNEIEVEALPTDLPEKFEVNLSSLAEIGDSITIASLKTNSKVEIKADPQLAIVLVQAQQVEEEVTPAPTETTPTEGEAEVKPSSDAGVEAKSE